MVVGLPGAAPQQDSQQPRTVFRANTALVSVDVVVRDAAGAVVRGLTDGRLRGARGRQVAANPQLRVRGGRQIGPGAVRSRGAARRRRVAPRRRKPREPRRRRRRAGAAPTPMTSDELAGRRLIVLLFDVSSMQPEDVQRAVDGATKYVNEKMSPADLVSVASISSMLERPDRLHHRPRDGRGSARHADARRKAPPRRPRTPAPSRPTKPSRPTRPRPTTMRPRWTCSTTTSGSARSRPSPTRWRRSIRRRRSSTSARDCSAAAKTIRSNCVRRSTRRCGAHVSIYPVDARGLQAIVPGGDATHASGRGTQLVLGRRRRQAVLRSQCVAGHAARRWRPTPAAARSSTRTTSARRSPACSATCRRTTCSATPAPTCRRTDGSAGFRSRFASPD